MTELTGELVRYEVRHRIAVVTVDNPPLNVVSPRVLEGVAAALQRLASDHSVDAAVVVGGGRHFVAGADIKTFDQPWEQRADPHATLALFDDCPKPVVAAIRGAALGGGVELALACHYRIADATASLGLPEVKLGLIPGGGGTQRLPRLVGAATAIEMITTGTPVNAPRAAEIGLVDEVTRGDVLDAALDRATALAADGTSLRRTRDLRVPADPPARHVIAAVRETVAARARGMIAPLRALDAVEAALTQPFDDGLAAERRIYTELMRSDQSKALRHVFLATRAASKIGDISPCVQPLPVHRAVVIGAGTMGSGIAMNFAAAGIDVTLIDSSAEALDRGLGFIEKSYSAAVSKGRLTEEEMAARLGRIGRSLDHGPVKAADIVVEAVFEDLRLKRDLFATLDTQAPPTAVLATNTSTLDIDEIARSTSRPGSVVGMHFFSPANVMRLLEIVRGAETSPEALVTAVAVGKRMSKTPVVVGVCDGFVSNRMFHKYVREASFLLEEGALPQQVDRVMTEFGMAMGPFAVIDLAGLDIGYQIRKEQAARRDPAERYAAIDDKIVEAGRLGQKTGAGFYRYDENHRRVPDPEVEKMIIAHSAEIGRQRREISDQEILERLLYQLVNEGAHILEEGIAQRPGDIDVVYVNGYGFPAHRGGPMFHAGLVGLPTVFDRVRRYHDEHGDTWRPAPLLARLADERATFERIPRS